MKPVQLMSYPIKNSTMTNGIVLDPFLGSGSTLIACCETDRVCRGIELDPKFVDCIVKRYYQYFVEYKNSSANVDDEIYVIRQGKRINYSEIAVQI